jgi:hypothetical protein
MRILNITKSEKLIERRESYADVTSLTGGKLAKKHLNCGGVPVAVFSVCIPKHESGISFSKTALECEGIRYAAVCVLSALAALAVFAHNRHVKYYL